MKTERTVLAILPMGNVAFVAPDEDESWSRERGEAFRDCAREMLADGAAPDAVAAACGYASHADFRRVFRRYVGETVRRWTLAQRRASPEP